MSNVKNIKHKILGNFFKKKRLEVKLSQVAVANYLGYDSPQMVSNWERGHCAPPYTSLKAIMEMYNISKPELIKIVSKATKEELEQLLK